MVLTWTIIYLSFRQFWNRLLSLTTVQVLAMLVIIWMSAVFNFWAAEQRVLYHYQILVYVTLFVSLVNPLLGIFLINHAEDKVTARILGIALVDFISYAGFFIIQMRRGKKLFHAYFWKYALLFNLPLLPHYLSMTVLNSADRIMIRNIVGEDKAGIYSLAYSVSNIMTMLHSALMQTISPWMYQKIKCKKTENIAPVAYMTLILVAAANLLLIVFAPEIVAIFAPAPYYEAIWIIPPVAMSAYFTYSYDLYAKFAFYYEKTLLIMMASVVGASLNVILNWIFIRHYGYIAAGYTTLFCYSIFSVAHYTLMNRICKIYCDGIRPYNSGIILKITIAFLLSGFLLLTTYNHRVIRYGILLISFSTIWLQRRIFARILRHLNPK